MEQGATTSNGQKAEAAKCFICDKTSIPCIPITAESKNTKTRFSVFIRKFLYDNKSDRIFSDDLDSQMLCDKCVDKIDEYDLACFTAERVAKEMCEILRKSERTVSKQIVENNYSENVEIFVVKPEITEIQFDCALVDESVDGNDFVDFDHTSTDKSDNDTEVKSMHDNQCPSKTESNTVHSNAENYSFNAKLATKISSVSIKIDESKNITNQKGDALENKNFQCDICEKNFSRKRYLAGHMRLHANFKEYSCECGKIFNRRDKMLEHRKTHDRTKERVSKQDPYECSECSATFRILKEFKVDIRYAGGCAI